MRERDRERESERERHRERVRERERVKKKQHKSLFYFKNTQCCKSLRKVIDFPSAHFNGQI